MFPSSLKSAVQIGILIFRAVSDTVETAYKVDKLKPFEVTLGRLLSKSAYKVDFLWDVNFISGFYCIVTIGSPYGHGSQS